MLWRRSPRRRRNRAGRRSRFVESVAERRGDADDDSVSFAFTYNRKPKQTQTLICALSGPTSSLGCLRRARRRSREKGRRSAQVLQRPRERLVHVHGLADADRRRHGLGDAALHASPCRPRRHLYWANYGTGTIGRANVDGTGANQSFISGASGPVGVAVDASHVYWANFDTGTIGRANLDGTGVNQSFITGASDPAGVAVDASHVYWANAGTGTIGRANLDGTGANQSFITGASSPGGVAVDAGHVYWGNASTDTIGRANLDGTGANQSFISRRLQPRRGGGRLRPRLLGQRRRGHDRAGEPGRDGREPELHQRRLRPRRGGGRRRPRLLGQPQRGHDRAGEPGRDGREPELHHRRLRPLGVAVDAGGASVSARAANQTRDPRRRPAPAGLPLSGVRLMSRRAPVIPAPDPWERFEDSRHRSVPEGPASLEALQFDREPAAEALRGRIPRQRRPFVCRHFLSLGAEFASLDGGRLRSRVPASARQSENVPVSYLRDADVASKQTT